MVRYVILVLSILLASAVAPPPSSSKTYRSDYEYNKRTDAFYKLHIETTHAYRAKQICAAEGTQLMVPSSKYDLMQVHGMFKKFPDIGDFVWVGDDGQKHESAEETPLIDLTNTEVPSWAESTQCDLVTRKGEVESAMCFMRRPFVCKVEAKEAPYDSQCGVYSLQYKYVQTLGSCYKIPNIPYTYTWDQAYAECSYEGSHLIILNSEAERDAVKEFLKTNPAIYLATADYFFFAGIRANRPTDGSARVFKTIFNETLEAAGYNEWSDGEPNNYQDSEYCGTIFSNNGKYNDVNCAHDYGFICEKEIHV